MLRKPGGSSPNRHFADVPSSQRHLEQVHAIATGGTTNILGGLHPTTKHHARPLRDLDSLWNHYHHVRCHGRWFVESEILRQWKEESKTIAGSVGQANDEPRPETHREPKGPVRQPLSTDRLRIEQSMEGGETGVLDLCSQMGWMVLDGGGDKPITALPFRSSCDTTVREIGTVCVESLQQFDFHQLGQIARPHRLVLSCYNCICGLFLFSPSNNMHAWHIA